MTDIPTAPDPQALFNLPETPAEVAALPDDPQALLADALRRIHDADMLMSEITHARLDWVRYQVESAKALTRIVEVADRLSGPLQVFHGAGEPAGLDVGPDSEPAEYVPQPVNGVRFEAVIGGGDNDVHLGLVSGREWIHVPGRGFVDVSAFEEREPVGDRGSVRWCVTGRVVSMTPDFVLGVTDGGMSVALPRGADLLEYPDDRR